jgi:hypothetical protein
MPARRWFGSTPDVRYFWPIVEDRLGEHRGRRRAVAGDVVGLAGDLAHELGAHVLERVLELDLLRDRDAVLGDLRAAEGLLDDDVLAGRAERDLDGLASFWTPDRLLARDVVEHDLLGHGISPPPWRGSRSRAGS